MVNHLISPDSNVCRLFWTALCHWSSDFIKSCEAGYCLVMNVSQTQTMETEEDHTCLHIKLYHPQQSCRGLYGLLPLGTRSRHSADDPLRLGRDAQTCTLALNDNRVSRKQLALHAYRSHKNPDMLFTIQNLSQRGQLSVNSSALGYLEKADLPDKALIRFGEYEMLIIREPGEAKGHFEVELEILAVPPSRETCMGVPSMTPVMDTGSCAMSSFPGELRAHGPLETDETLWCNSWWTMMNAARLFTHFFFFFASEGKNKCSVAVTLGLKDV